ncbi:MAG: glycyl-radical enzyme activating protein [Bacillota bacterium]|nr:glycyl-radical enzyme activating protein [Bacillota bacterium]
MTKAMITNIQKYSVHDGPGIRSTVFFKGCPLLCAWCHNPENQIFGTELVWRGEKCIGCGSCIEACPRKALSAGSKSIQRDVESCIVCGKCADVCPTLAWEKLGEDYDLERLMKELSKDAVFYEQSGGGVTLSGGEPLSHADFAAEVLRACKEKAWHTAVDTCGFVPRSAFEKVLPYTDLFLYDIKQLDEEQHRLYMQTPIGPIVENLQWLMQQGANVWLRLPIIPGVNDDTEQISRVISLAKECGLRKVFLLPYHKMAAAKYQRMGMEYKLPDLEDPSMEQMEELRNVFAREGFETYIGG